jgi:hypothetical protein
MPLCDPRDSYRLASRKREAKGDEERRSTHVINLQRIPRFTLPAPPITARRLERRLHLQPLRWAGIILLLGFDAE